MKSKYVKPCVSGTGKEIENAIPAALAGFALALASGVAAGAVARKAVGDSILSYHSKPNLSE